MQEQILHNKRDRKCVTETPPGGRNRKMRSDSVRGKGKKGCMHALQSMQEVVHSYEPATAVTADGQSAQPPGERGHADSLCR